jgi:hypothetical protein
MRIRLYRKPGGREGLKRGERGSGVVLEDRNETRDVRNKWDTGGRIVLRVSV